MISKMFSGACVVVAVLSWTVDGRAADQSLIGFGDAKLGMSEDDFRAHPSLNARPHVDHIMGANLSIDGIQWNILYEFASGHLTSIHTYTTQQMSPVSCREFYEATNRTLASKYGVFDAPPHEKSGDPLAVGWEMVSILEVTKSYPDRSLHSTMYTINGATRELGGLTYSEARRGADMQRYHGSDVCQVVVDYLLGQKPESPF